MNSLLRRLYREQDGQTLYLVAASMVAILGMAALSIDIGYAMHAQRELQANADAAANAGGAAMPNPATTSVVNVVDAYSGQTSSEYNYHKDLNITAVNVQFACLVTTTSNFNLPPCSTAPNTGTPSYPLCGEPPAPNQTANPYSGCNALQVVETATIPTFFAKVFGFKSLNLTATSVASASGNAVPYHIMLVLDTTASMASGSDTGCLSSNPNNTYTPEQCAQMGVQTLLTDLAPCAQGQTCTNGNSTPVDEVGIMVFPGLCSDTASGITTRTCPTLPSGSPLTNTTANSTYAPKDVSCPSTAPPITPYNNDPEYLLLGFQDNYQVTDSSGLNTAANIVESVGAGTWIATDTANNCGLSAPGGEGTFYAGAIVAAQTYLTNNHTSHVQDIMILLSDGDATADTTQMGGNVNQTVLISGMSGHLYSATAECTQAVNAADWAKGVVQTDNTSTKIYSVSYGSETSGCTAGENVPAIGGNNANTPCATMAGIASPPLSQYFFSVPQTVKGVTGTVCKDAVQISKLNQVFSAISSQLQRSRLVPTTVSANWVAP